MAFKNCPKCNELLGENVNFCFACKYDFDLKRIRSNDDEKCISDKKQRVLIEKQTTLENEKQKKIQVEKEKCSIIQKNAQYEYTTESIMDRNDGYPNIELIKKTLCAYALEGWRLHTALSNEIGKSSASSGIGGFSSGTNATINITILIFERCIKIDEN